MAERYPILGVQVDALTVNELHARMLEIVRRQQHALVLNANVNALNLAQEHDWFHDLLNRAPIVFCDGAGVMLGARLLGHRIPERITFADWMWDLAEFAVANDLTFYFLGGRPGVAERAADEIRKRNPAVRILGVSHGYFDKTPDHQENLDVIADINRLRPNILVLGFGMPLQERWMLENWDRTEADIALAGGAVFDYLSGDLQRAPSWMTASGLEWLGRLMIEPRRLWRRYLLGNPLFLWRVLQQRFGKVF